METQKICNVCNVLKPLQMFAIQSASVDFAALPKSLLFVEQTSEMQALGGSYHKLLSNKSIGKIMVQVQVFGGAGKHSIKGTKIY